MRFQHPFTCVIAGATGSGKTVFVTRLLQYADAMINFPPKKIYWQYGARQTQFETLTNVEFIEGLPNIENVDKTKRTLIIIDDLMNETNRSVTTYSRKEVIITTVVSFTSFKIYLIKTKKTEPFL